MNDVCILLGNEPGALARMGEVLGNAGVSIEGGGAAVVGEDGIAHFLFQDGKAARAALEASGIRVLAVRDVLLQSLNQDEPGQLGRFSRTLSKAGINIEVLYSDHEHRLVVVVDDHERGRQISEEWERQRLAKQTAASPGVHTHSYSVTTLWTSSGTEGTVSYRSYSRNHTVQTTGKPIIEASSDPAFRGDSSRYNPEELLVASLSSCHMLWYLHLCAAAGIKVMSYEDQATGQMEERSDGSGVFKEVTLNPRVCILQAEESSRAQEIHHEAHASCFIANSVNFPVRVDGSVIGV